MACLQIDRDQYMYCGISQRIQKTISEHLCSSPDFSGFVLLDLQFYMYVLQIVVCTFVLFLLAIVLSVLSLLFTDSDYLPLVSSNSSDVYSITVDLLEMKLTTCSVLITSVLWEINRCIRLYKRYKNVVHVCGGILSCVERSERT